MRFDHSHAAVCAPPAGSRSGGGSARLLDGVYQLTLRGFCFVAGTRSAGNPHATCDEAGAGNGVLLQATAPVVDPTRPGKDQIPAKKNG